MPYAVTPLFSLRLFSLAADAMLTSYTPLLRWHASDEATVTAWHTTSRH